MKIRLSTGSIDLTVSGGTPGYTYMWTTGATTQDVSGLAANTYTVTVTDVNNCTKTTSVTISQSSAIVLSTTQVNVLCNGEATGSIDLTVSGGTPGYTFAWTGGATTEDLSTLTAGTYTVTVTDAEHLHPNHLCDHNRAHRYCIDRDACKCVMQRRIHRFY